MKVRCVMLSAVLAVSVEASGVWAAGEALLSVTQKPQPQAPISMLGLAMPRKPLPG